MLTREFRDLELYLDCAAKIKVLERILVDTNIALSALIPRNNYQKLESAYDSLCHIKGELERRMLKDYPETKDKGYENVFWGGIKGYYELDKRVEQKAKEYTKMIIGGIENHD